MLEAIRALLEQHGAEFRELHHEPTRTSQQAADARGEPMEIGGKAIVAKVDETFRLFVLSAARRLHSNDRIAFNAGSLEDSIIIDRQTWLEIARPVEVFPFSRP